MIAEKGINTIPKGKKWCPCCKIPKSRGDFDPHKVNKDGLVDYCHSCKSDQQSDYQKRNKSRKKQAKYRARKRNAFVEVVDPLVVYERDEGICGICGQFIPPSEKYDVDHIIPLAKKGTHSYRNSQLSHIHCNSWKSGRMVVVEDGEWFFKKKKDEESLERFLARL